MATVTTDHTVTATAEPVAVATISITRDEQAMMLVKSYVPWAIGAGVVPMPLLDTAALVAVQMRMLSKLSELYGVPFRENGAKGIVTSLLSTVISSGLAASLGSLVKLVPVVGTLAGAAAVPGMYAAATYAMGRVFVTHFEAGGTFLDFDPKKTREYYKAEFETAKRQQASSK